MRLHQLEIAAFGPFAGRVHVDLDELSAGGIFLLTGATGAGKTSVLDAVCFALYGEVPGDRQAARRLRSDHAPADAPPSVTLELTLAGRRFRIARSPAWQRPKRRGVGTTTQHASVRLSERREGQWHQLSARLDETGHLVTHLVGLNLTQFCQVAMLPQGRFQAFLRARSDERQRLLQQIFRTARFEQVERWLHDHRLGLRRDAEAARSRVCDLVSRIAEVADAPEPPPQDADLDATAGVVTDWARGLRAKTAAATTTAEAVAASATAVEHETRSALDAGRALADRHARVTAAIAELAELEGRRADVDAVRSAVEAADRAAGVLPLVRLRDEADRRRDAAADELTVAGAAAERVLGIARPDAETLSRLRAEAADLAAQVRAVRPREAELAEAAEAVAAAQRRHDELAVTIRRTTTVLEGLPARLEALRGDLDHARTAALGVPVVEARLAELDARSEALGRVAGLVADLDRADEQRRTAAAVVTHARERWLDVREARLAGMAAEIAGRLAVGDACPVCGSADHPRPAQAESGAADAAGEKQALARVDDAKSTEHLYAEQCRDLGTRLAVAREQAGDETSAALASRRAQARAELADLRAAAQRATTLAADIRAAEDRERRERGDLEGRRREQARVEASAAGQERRAAEARAALDGVLEGTGAHDLVELLETLQERIEVARRGEAALAALDAAERHLQESQASLEEAVVDAGFAVAADAVAAGMSEDDRRARQTVLRRYDDRLAVVREVLDEPGAGALASRPPPDVAALEDAHTAAGAVSGRARTRSASCVERQARLADLGTALDVAVGSWAPTQQALTLATAVSGLAEGKSADNRLQMRLSAYVLAHRLSQVVAAANERLSRMSGRRYRLEHTGGRGARDPRGGLGLVVHDDWSGESRDPVTLSGGETFVVSLALALGLADVTAHEVGGADLDTLFVDEGFGSLDAETLDDVMDTLDSLREGGRVVGVVSHVPELRDRIPTQLTVTKARGGSTLAIGSRP